jgi:hypothetical protein
MDLREIGFGGVDWIRLSQDRDRWRDVVSAVMNLRVLAPRSQLVSFKNLLHWTGKVKCTHRNGNAQRVSPSCYVRIHKLLIANTRHKTRFMLRERVITFHSLKFIWLMESLAT